MDTADNPGNIYYVDADARDVRGPYHADEIQPQIAARRYLGWPDAEVYRVEARDQADAREKARQQIRRDRA